MLDPGLLQNPALRNWLGGIEPAWTLLDLNSFAALRDTPPPATGPIRLASNLSQEEIERSAIARNALILMQAAATGPGLKMTVTGNLARDVVAEMIDLFTWPGFDKEQAFQMNRVINEPDFLPLFFLRHIVEAGKLVHRHKGHLKITPAGRRILDVRDQGGLQAVLFRLTFWLLDLAYLGRGLHHGWPQCDIGIVLWCLSIAANDWQSPDRLTRLCTIPIDDVVNATRDTASLAMGATILRPLLWFGLLEYREESMDGDRLNRNQFYRKTPLFDRFLSFDIKLEAVAGPRH